MAHLVHDTNGRRQSYQSSWMSRWMRTSCNTAGKSLNSSSNATVNDLNRIAKDILVTPSSVKGLGIIETATSELVNASRRPSTESLRNERSCSTSLEFYSPSVRDHHFQKVQKLLGHGPSPSQYIASAKTGLEQSCFECYSLHKLPHCIHDVETMKISTSSDSVEGGFSQTSNILLITVKSGASLPKERDILATRKVITKINRNIPSDLHRLSPFSSQGKQRVILEPLTCSADSEGGGYAGDIKTSEVTLNKVSSAETDNMDMNFSEETNPLLGGHSASSDKACHMEANSDSSSSKTPGLEVEIPMKCADQAKQKSNLCMNISPKAEPGYRWVKRLKLSSSHSSGRGTESINLAENSNRKRNNFFSRVLKSDVTRSESTLRIGHGKESMALDKSINLSKENLGKDLSLSHAWIQRWLRDGSNPTRKKPFTMVDCEPQSLKRASEDLQKDRSPSIRAMALMGKAMKSFQPCQLHKRGYLTIWKTKDV